MTKAEFEKYTGEDPEMEKIKLVFTQPFKDSYITSQCSRSMELLGTDWDGQMILKRGDGAIGKAIQVLDDYKGK